MELSKWVSEHMTILVGIPVLLLALLVPLRFATRGQRAAGRQKSTGGDSTYVPIVPDTSGSADTL
jgi:hypothetical protein